MTLACLNFFLILTYWRPIDFSKLSLGKTPMKQLRSCQGHRGESTSVSAKQLLGETTDIQFIKKIKTTLCSSRRSQVLQIRRLEHIRKSQISF